MALRVSRGTHRSRSTHKMCHAGTAEPAEPSLELRSGGLPHQTEDHIALKVSYTVIWPPLFKTGHPLAISVAASSDFASTML